MPNMWCLSSRSPSAKLVYVLIAGFIALGPSHKSYCPVLEISCHLSLPYCNLLSRTTCTITRVQNLVLDSLISSLSLSNSLFTLLNRSSLFHPALVSPQLVSAFVFHSSWEPPWVMQSTSCNRLYPMYICRGTAQSQSSQHFFFSASLHNELFGQELY